jgi:DNA-binding transcriptional LysR family regulator
MNLDTLTLKCFLAVSETGSFTRAAERVGRTQSAISQQISKLEELVGKALFIRGNALKLTADGEIFQTYARQILSLHLEALSRFKEPELEGEVHFGLPENFTSLFLSDVLVDFVRIHPRILVNIECDLTLNLYERFKKGEFDMVLVKMSRPEDFPNGLEVWSEKLEWVGDKNMLSLIADPSKPVPLVLSPQPCVYRSSALKALENAGRRWRIVFSSPSYAGTLAAVRAGLGVTVLPHTMVPHQLDALVNAGLPPLSDTHVSLIKHDTTHPAIRSFEEFVLKRLQH